MTHTSGPWETRYHLLLEEKRKLASLETLTKKQKLNLGQINNDLHHWYALREAAPAMLEALKELLRRTGETEVNSIGLEHDSEALENAYTQAEEAIRLAEGRAL